MRRRSRFPRASCNRSSTCPNRSSPKSTDRDRRRVPAGGLVRPRRRLGSGEIRRQRHRCRPVLRNAGRRPDPQRATQAGHGDVATINSSTSLRRELLDQRRLPSNSARLPSAAEPAASGLRKRRGPSKHSTHARLAAREAPADGPRRRGRGRPRKWPSSILLRGDERGKSTTLLQADFNYRERGMETMLWTAAHDDRAAPARSARASRSPRRRTPMTRASTCSRRSARS